MKKLTISLCMIVKNEEEHLRKCLESVHGVVDEIVIVDTGSTDKTLDIAKEFGARIYHFEWVDSFAAARNYSIEQSTSDYNLVLDADEYLGKNADLKSELVSNNDYYLMRIKNFISTGGAFTHSAVRLFRNKRELFYRNRLHEHLNVYDEGNNFKGGELNTLIYHIGYSNEIMIARNKAERNLPLMIQEVKENPTGYNLYNLGKAYLAKENYAEALKYFSQAYPLSRDRVYLGELLTKMSVCLAEVGRPIEALEVLKDAVVLLPEDADLRYTQGKIYMAAGYYRDAEASFQKCLEIGDKGVMVTEGAGGYLSEYMLSEVYEGQRELLKSFNQVVSVMQQKKTFVPNIVKYFELMLKTNIPVDDALSNIKTLYQASNLEELTKLLEVLYNFRHPFLYRFILDYKINVEQHVMNVAKQYSKSYEEARTGWNKLDQIDKDNAMDIVILSLILKDEELLSIVKDMLNLSKKDWKLLNKVVVGEIVEESLSKDLELILIKVSKHLIILQEFEMVEFVSKLLLQGSAETGYKVSKLLSDYGYIEAAIDMLLANITKYPTHVNTIELLGDLCLREDNFQDALVLYNRLIDFKKEYSTYERFYNLYERMKDKEGMSMLRKEIRVLFPLSNWINSSEGIMRLIK